MGKSCVILRYTVYYILTQENQFSQNLMNSIGVDFKLKNIELENKKIKLQIVKGLLTLVGYSWTREI